MDAKHKKQIIKHGIGLHLVAYVIIGLFLLLIGVPFFIAFSIVLVLSWGLFVMSYAFYYHK